MPPQRHQPRTSVSCAPALHILFGAFLVFSLLHTELQGVVLLLLFMRLVFQDRDSFLLAPRLPREIHNGIDQLRMVHALAAARDKGDIEARPTTSGLTNHVKRNSRLRRHGKWNSRLRRHVKRNNRLRRHGLRQARLPRSRVDVRQYRFVLGALLVLVVILALVLALVLVLVLVLTLVLVLVLILVVVLLLILVLVLY